MADQFSFSGTIPENYDKYLGPLLFEPYAVDIADRVKSGKYINVLELACGTGRVTSHIERVLPEGSHLTATDINPDMIETAKKKVKSDKKIAWKTADIQSLPFEDSSFDLVVSQFGIMFVPDKEKAYSEVYRVLKPGGKFLFNTWDKTENNMLISYTQEIVNTFFRDNPIVFFNIPYSYYNADEIKEQLNKAGLKKISISVVKKEGLSNSAKSAAEGLIEGTPTIMGIKERNPGLPNAVKEKVEKILSEKFGSEPMKCQLQAIVVEAVKE